MSIRRLTPDDAATYRALMLDAYALDPSAFTSTAAERAALPLTWWQDRLASGSATREIVLGAWRDSQLVGVAGLRFEDGARVRHKATLFGMAVRPEARRQAVGRQLVEAALALARSRPPVRVVQLTVTQGNRAARALYASCGFFGFGIEPLAVALDDGFVAKEHMWCDLGPAGGTLPRLLAEPPATAN